MTSLSSRRPKCGTTWMQTIVALLLSGDPEVETELSVRMPSGRHPHARDGRSRGPA